MADQFFVPGQTRAAKVDQLFTLVARRYDLVNDLQSFGLHRYWKRRVARLADVHPGDCALDVCCGTGDLTFALALRGAKTVGLDFNEAMLRMAEAKTPTHRLPFSKRDKRELDLPSIRFVQGDAQQLPFPDCSFDIVTIGYGLRNLANWEKGLREMQRVARVGGRLIVLEFGKPDNPLLRGPFFGYLKVFVPLLGRIFCGNAAAYAYILESLKYYPAQNGVADKMQELGLGEVRTINLLGGMMSINYSIKKIE